MDRSLLTNELPYFGTSIYFFYKSLYIIGTLYAVPTIAHWYFEYTWIGLYGWHHLATFSLSLSLSLTHTHTHGPATEPLMCEKDGPAHQFNVWQVSQFSYKRHGGQLIYKQCEKDGPAHLFKTWRIHICDMTNAYVWLMHMFHVTPAYVWHGTFICVKWRIHMCGMSHSYVWRSLFICMTWLIHVCDMTPSCVWKWLIGVLIIRFMCLCVCVHTCVSNRFDW